MNIDIELRVQKVAEYILETKATVRDAAKEFGVSKSTVHYDMQTRLKQLDLELFEQVRQIMHNNFNERHIRGGESTKRKYENKHNM